MASVLLLSRQSRLIDCCFTFCGKYFLHMQDGNKLTNGGLHWVEHLALHLAAYSPLALSCYKGSLSCLGRGISLTRASLTSSSERIVYLFIPHNLDAPFRGQVNRNGFVFTTVERYSLSFVKWIVRNGQPTKHNKALFNYLFIAICSPFSQYNRSIVVL